MTAVHIRRAEKADIPELTHLAVGASEAALAGGPEDAPPRSGSNLLAAEIREGWVDMFVAEARGRLVGFFSFVPGAGHIRHIYVHRDRHRQGIGSLMMAAAFDILRERGFDEATIDVVEGTDGDGFNRAMGWRVIRRQRRDDGAVVISMRKIL